MDRLTLLFPILLTVLHQSVSGVKSTTFTLRNKCSYTVWPGILSDEGAAPLATTGFALQTGESQTITAPPSWGGRFWGRTLCAQESAGRFSCSTGDCGSGQIECAGSGAASPATLAEFTLHNHSAGGLDFYDVSLVDGYNLPILVAPQGGSGGNCTAAGCVGDVNGACPWELQVVSAYGNVVACNSACGAFDSPQYCCTGPYNTPDTCKPSSYSAVFKRACPSAYSYPYDDSTSTFACASANYTITFCPYPENRTSPASQPQSPPPPPLAAQLQSLPAAAAAAAQLQSLPPPPPAAQLQSPPPLPASITTTNTTNTTTSSSSASIIINTTTTTTTSPASITTTTTGGSSQLQPPPPPPGSDYSVCSYTPYKCGELPNLYYPFWGDGQRPPFCGGGDQFNLTCQQDHQYPSIQIGSQIFEVRDIDTKANTMTMGPLLEGPDVCSPQFNISLSPLFRYNQTVHNITVFSDCPSGVALIGGNNFTCGSDNRVLYYVGAEDEVLKQHPDLEKCGRRIQVPAEAVHLPSDGDGVAALNGTFGIGFNVSYTISQECMRCLESGGACGSNDATHEFTCYCPDGSNHLDCTGDHGSNRRHWKRQVIIGVTGAVISGLLICCFICKLSGWQEKSWPTRSNQDIEAFLKTHGALTLKRYKFSDVKKMTNSFKIKLGQGGFGAVYKGNLLDGSNVAIKILNRSKGNGKDFINEVASISRTSHVNVVTLLGFCIEGRKTVLIYEFMSNGSLDKFINKKGHENTPSLSWDNLYQIAIGIARGLEYLHRGCNTRILHFDIKPHNILLDENFCPKISDFGLAKLCPRKKSIISMSDARGTIGYVAPEVCNRHFGGVSHKSDVYSYGMVLLEIVGGRKNIKAEVSHTDETYFPDWIYKRLEQDTHLGLDGEVTIEENEVIKRMTVVGLWCIQPIPNDRPTMSRVIEMLEGNMNSLEMPPKPVLSSPVRSMAESSTTVN